MSSLTPSEVQRYEEKVIGDNVTSSLFFNFLMGMYTMVYLGTMYLYLLRRGLAASQRVVVLPTISILYALCTAYFGIQWYFVEWSLVSNGATRKSVFEATLSPPVWQNIANLLLQNSMIIVADGLLIWRCFYLWDKSWRVIAAPLLFVFTEIVLLIPTTHFSLDNTASAFNTLNATTFAISAATTVSTTSLIAYRIYITSRLSGITSLARFKHISRILIESAAIYAVVILLNAVDVALSTSNGFDTPVGDMIVYIFPLLPITAGMAPTIVVARIVTTKSDDTHIATITHISGLQFRSQRDTRQSRSHIGSHSAHIYALDLERGSAELETNHEKNKADSPGRLEFV